MTILMMVPGYGNSGPFHWQSFWEKKFPDCRRVVQDFWEKATREEWVTRLDQEIRKVPSGTSLMLIAHSLGCSTIAHWAQDPRFQETREKVVIKGVMLVAPYVPDQERIILDIQGFKFQDNSEINYNPLLPMPFPSQLIVSTNDVFITRQEAEFLSSKWEARLIWAGDLGHINSDSRLGDWPWGQEILFSFLQTFQT